MDVIVVGAGLAGLAAASHLTRAGASVRVLESGDAPGGRVRTDLVRGFRLDRGFQVLLPSYPELRRAVRLAELAPRRLWRGAYLVRGGRRRLLAGPWHGTGAAAGLADFARRRPGDAAALAALSLRDMAAPGASLRRLPEAGVEEELSRWGISRQTIETALRPFLSGVFLDPSLAGSARLFHLIWRCFLRGGAAVPAFGMQQLPTLLARGLPQGSLRTGRDVREVDSGGVVLADGTREQADAVIVATDGTTAAGLLPELDPPAWHAVTTWYFALADAPLRAPALVLDGDSDLLLNSVVHSEVSAAYAPDRRALVSASVPGVADHDGVLEPRVRGRLTSLYRTDARAWELLATYPIERALPVLAPGASLRAPVRVGPGRYVCGDHRDTPSIQGALVSGRRAATAVLAGAG